ncbi:hypothetical protein P7C70_g7855, partial [Phenoliferia sp. Uapishka_3]
ISHSTSPPTTTGRPLRLATRLMAPPAAAGAAPKRRRKAVNSGSLTPGGSVLRLFRQGCVDDDGACVPVVRCAHRKKGQKLNIRANRPEISGDIAVTAVEASGGAGTGGFETTPRANDGENDGVNNRMHGHTVQSQSLLTVNALGIDAALLRISVEALGLGLSTGSEGIHLLFQPRSILLTTSSAVNAFDLRKNLAPSLTSGNVLSNLANVLAGSEPAHAFNFDSYADDASILPHWESSLTTPDTLTSDGAFNFDLINFAPDFSFLSDDFSTESAGATSSFPTSPFPAFSTETFSTLSQTTNSIIIQQDIDSEPHVPELQRSSSTSPLPMLPFSSDAFSTNPGPTDSFPPPPSIPNPTNHHASTQFDMYATPTAVSGPLPPPVTSSPGASPAKDAKRGKGKPKRDGKRGNGIFGIRARSSGQRSELNKKWLMEDAKHSLEKRLKKGLWTEAQLAARWSDYDTCNKLSAVKCKLKDNPERQTYITRTLWKLQQDICEFSLSTGLVATMHISATDDKAAFKFNEDKILDYTFYSSNLRDEEKPELLDVANNTHDAFVGGMERYRAARLTMAVRVIEERDTALYKAHRAEEENQVVQGKLCAKEAELVETKEEMAAKDAENAKLRAIVASLRGNVEKTLVT